RTSVSKKKNARKQKELIAKVLHRYTKKLFILTNPHMHAATHTPPIPSQSSDLAERQQRQRCGAVCRSLCTHLSPPAILASVIPLVHLNTDAELASLLCSHLVHEDTGATNVTGPETADRVRMANFENKQIRKRRAQDGPIFQLTVPGNDRK
ncbi:uncharacterized protein V6R79_004458, partial [Siganus canaliculatus]